MNELQVNFRAKFWTKSQILLHMKGPTPSCDNEKQKMLMGSIAETDTKLIIFSQTFILGVSKKTIPLITPKKWVAKWPQQCMNLL